MKQAKQLPTTSIRKKFTK